MYTYYVKIYEGTNIFIGSSMYTYTTPCKRSCCTPARKPCSMNSIPVLCIIRGFCGYKLRNSPLNKISGIPSAACLLQAGFRDLRSGPYYVMVQTIIQGPSQHFGPTTRSPSGAQPLSQPETLPAGSQAPLRYHQQQQMAATGLFKQVSVGVGNPGTAILPGFAATRFDCAHSGLYREALGKRKCPC